VRARGRGYFVSLLSSLLVASLKIVNAKRSKLWPRIFNWEKNGLWPTCRGLALFATTMSATNDVLIVLWTDFSWKTFGLLHAMILNVLVLWNRNS
jgi:hypothetical protein